MQETYSKNELKKLSGRSPEWVQSVLDLVEPVESTVGEDGRQFNRYTSEDFIRGVQQKYSEDRSAKAKIEEVKYQRALDELKLSRGQLIHSEEFRRLMAEQNKRVIETLSGLSDQVERRCGPELVVIQTIDEITEETMARMHESMTEATELHSYKDE